LLLSVNFKRLNLWSKLLVVLAASIAAETIQYIFAIGATDITDIITNALGGLIGLSGYDLCRKYLDQENLDGFIVVAGSLLLGLCVLLLVILEVRHGVRYHTHGESGGLRPKASEMCPAAKVTFASGLLTARGHRTSFLLDRSDR
jgi:hypothetical protein